MSAARIALVAAVLLGLVALVSAGSVRQETDGLPPAGGAVPRVAAAPEVVARLPDDRPVRAEAGDVVRLRVRLAEVGVAEVPGLELEWPVGGRATGELVFVAARPGRFGVRLRRDGRRLGVLEVAG